MKSVYLLTGMPGTGKTSLIRQVVDSLKDKAGGFYTEEIRTAGTRQGFRIVTLNGPTAILAHINIRSPYRISKYGVDTGALETIGIPSLRQAMLDCEVIIVDEIGRMELFSTAFKTTVMEIIDSGRKVLGTIMFKPEPWADIIKSRPQVKLITVTRNNHQQVLGEIREWLGV